MPKDNEISEKYLCSITSQVMIDPVIAADGHTYEREAIEKWLEAHDTSPKTNEALEDKKLRTNHDKRGSLLKFLDKHSELYDGKEVYLPKSWVAQLVMDIKGNKTQEIQRWLDKDRRLLTSKLEGDSTALHLACEFSSPELVDIILKNLKQRNKSVIPGVDGFKPIHLNVLLESALNNGDHVQCELLLKLGAEVEQPEAVTQNTLLHRMVINGNQKAATWLLDQKAILESRNIDKNTPLLLSVIGNRINITEFLLKANARFQVENAQQETAFYIAVENDNIEMVKLLSMYGADPTIVCGTAQLSTLHIAAERGDKAMLEYLLQTKAAVLIDFQNANGDTPLHLAVQAGHDAIISLLLEAGAYHKIKNEQEQTPIELAKIQQKHKLASLIVQTVRALKQSKLKETNRVHQVVAEQASEITHLKAALQSQEQDFKSIQSDMQAQIKKLELLLQPAVLQPSPIATELRFSTAPSPKSFHTLAAEPNIQPTQQAEKAEPIGGGEVCKPAVVA
jgi:ankyrin repeat protein